MDENQAEYERCAAVPQGSGYVYKGLDVKAKTEFVEKVKPPAKKCPVCAGPLCASARVFCSTDCATKAAANLRPAAIFKAYSFLCGIGYKFQDSNEKVELQRQYRDVVSALGAVLFPSEAKREKEAFEKNGQK